MRNLILVLTIMSKYTAMFVFFVSLTNGKSTTSKEAVHSEEKQVQLQPKKVTAAVESSAICEPCSCPRPCQPQPDCTSSCIAAKAAQEAGAAAAAQQIAAALASHQVKAQLAEKAIQAARAAKAALVGKLIQVNQLECTVNNALAVTMQQAASCQRTQNNLEISLTAAAHAQQLLKTLMDVLRLSSYNVYYAREAATGISEELVQKAALLEAAKCRLDTLMGELCVARQDLAVIHEAACKAQAAAKCACSCAQRCKRMTGSNNVDNKDLNDLLEKILQNGRKVTQLLRKASSDGKQ